MLDVRDPLYLTAVRDFAERNGQLADLEGRLRFLATYACRVHADRVDATLTRCVLMKDHAPYSFEFAMFKKDLNTGEYHYWFSGGLIYHGSHDGFGSGAAPTFAVSLSPAAGWSVHT